MAPSTRPNRKRKEITAKPAAETVHNAKRQKPDESSPTTITVSVEDLRRLIGSVVKEECHKLEAKLESKVEEVGRRVTAQTVVLRDDQERSDDKMKKRLEPMKSISVLVRDMHSNLELTKNKVEGVEAKLTYETNDRLEVLEKKFSGIRDAYMSMTMEIAKLCDTVEDVDNTLKASKPNVTNVYAYPTYGPGVHSVTR